MPQRPMQRSPRSGRPIRKHVAASMAGIAPIQMETPAGTANRAAPLDARRMPATTDTTATAMAPIPTVTRNAPSGATPSTNHIPSGAHAATGRIHEATRATMPKPRTSFLAATLSAAT